MSGRLLSAVRLGDTAAVGASVRRRALALVLAAQAALFAILVPRPPVVVADNSRYETAGWLLASGQGLSLPFAVSRDTDTRQWACERHPEACPGDLAPTAMYPPGYQFYVAAVYSVAGRNLWALIATQFVLLLVLFALFERVLAKRATSRVGYAFGMAICATYPFLARQAGLVMSDHVHAVLLFSSLAAFDLMRPGLRRGLVGGLLFSLATLTRPYSVACIPFLLAAMALQSDRRPRRAEIGVWLVTLALPLAAWSVRNQIVFGRFIPFTTTGIGHSLFLNKLERTIGSTLYTENVLPTFAEMARVTGGRDWASWAAKNQLTDEGLAWMREHPVYMTARVLQRIPRLWVSLGRGRVSSAWPFLVVYLGGLLTLGVIGMWQTRGDRTTWIYAAVILTYWAFLLHAPVEARRTLPLRLPMLLFAVSAVEKRSASWAYGRNAGAVQMLGEAAQSGRSSPSASARSRTNAAAPSAR